MLAQDAYKKVTSGIIGKIKESEGIVNLGIPVYFTKAGNSIQGCLDETKWIGTIMSLKQ